MKQVCGRLLVRDRGNAVKKLLQQDLDYSRYILVDFQHSLFTLGE